MSAGANRGATPRRRATRLEAAGIGAGVGLALTFPAIGLAVMSAGMGHGSYLAASILLPFAMLLTTLTGGEIAAPSIALAVAQMPLEGALIGAALAARRPLGAFLVVSAHLLAVALCSGLSAFS